jgi:anti-anti-sigma factor
VAGRDLSLGQPLAEGLYGSMKQLDLDISEEQHEGWVRLSLIGELDLLTAAALQDRLDAFASQTRDVVLDLSHLEFIDSTGIRVLVGALQRSRDGSWDLQIEPSLTVNVRRVLKLVNLDRYILANDLGPEIGAVLSD